MNDGIFTRKKCNRMQRCETDKNIVGAFFCVKCRVLSNFIQLISILYSDFTHYIFQCNENSSISSKSIFLHIHSILLNIDSIFMWNFIFQRNEFTLFHKKWRFSAHLFVLLLSFHSKFPLMELNIYNKKYAACSVYHLIIGIPVSIDVEKYFL